MGGDQGLVDERTDGASASDGNHAKAQEWDRESHDAGCDLPNDHDIGRVRGDELGRHGVAFGVDEREVGARSEKLKGHSGREQDEEASDCRS